MESFVVLILLSIIYAIIAICNISDRDSEIVCSLQIQLIFCYYFVFHLKPSDMFSCIISWHLGLVGSILVGGSIGAITKEYIKIDMERNTTSYWLHLFLANLVVSFLVVLLLILSL